MYCIIIIIIIEITVMLGTHYAFLESAVGVRQALFGIYTSLATEKFSIEQEKLERGLFSVYSCYDQLISDWFQICIILFNICICMHEICSDRVDL